MLVRTVRTARGPRHQVVARLGDGAEITAARSWQDLDAVLEGRPPATQLKPPSVGCPSPAARWREVDVSGMRVERLRQFGRVYLGLALWQRLGLHTFLRELAGTVRLKRPDAGTLTVTPLDANGYRVGTPVNGAAEITLLPDRLYYLIER